jgi:hypothetical protein
MRPTETGSLSHAARCGAKTRSGDAMQVGAGSALILILIFGIIGGSKVTLAIVDSKERHF